MKLGRHKGRVGWLAISIASYSRLSLMIFACHNSVLNVKALVGAFNQEKVLVGAFSVIVKTGCGTDGALHSTSPY